MRRYLGAALALAAVTAGGHAQVGDAKHLVIPGESLGVVRLGMNAPEVHAALEAIRAVPMLTSDGKPAGYRDTGAGAVIELWQVDPIGKDRYIGMMKVFFVGPKVVQIGVNSPLFATRKGASIRQASSDFRKFHSSLASTGAVETWSGKVRIYDSIRMGLAVSYVVPKSGREPGSAQEIFVHEPGTPLRIESPRKKAEPKPPAQPGPTAVTPEPGPEAEAGKPTVPEKPAEPSPDEPDAKPMVPEKPSDPEPEAPVDPAPESPGE